MPPKLAAAQIAGFHLLMSSCWCALNAAALAESDVILERKLSGSGFHRDLKTTLSLPKNVRHQHSFPGCTLLLFETLPPSVYADPFQIQSLVPFGGPQVLFDRAVDIEAAEFLSKPHELFIFLTKSEFDAAEETSVSIMSVSIPIHARYHRPAMDPTMSHATAIILHPGLYSNCTKSDKENTLLAPCDPSNTTMCNWTHMSYKCSSPVIQLQIPVGQQRDKPLVVLVTLLVGVGVCAWLIKIIWTSSSHDKDS